MLFLGVCVRLSGCLRVEVESPLEEKNPRRNQKIIAIAVSRKKWLVRVTDWEC